MSMKTLIVFAIFGALMFLYIVYMSGEFSKSNKKLEAFEEAASSLKTEQSSTSTSTSTSAAPTSTSSTTTSTSSTTSTPTSSMTSTTTTGAPTSSMTTTTGTPTSSTMTTTRKPTPIKDLEKTLYIVNAYEGIYGTKIGPDELEELDKMFVDVEDRDVIYYKLKELHSQSTEVDAIFELVDVSNKLGSIVNRLKARAGARAEVQVSSNLISKGETTMGPTSGPTSTPTTSNRNINSDTTVEGYRPLPKYLSF